MEDVSHGNISETYLVVHQLPNCIIIIILVVIIIIIIITIIIMKKKAKKTDQAPGPYGIASERTHSFPQSD